MQRTEERYYEPELHRLKAELLAAHDQTAQAAHAAAAVVSRRVARVGAVRREGAPNPHATLINDSRETGLAFRARRPPRPGPWRR